MLKRGFQLVLVVSFAIGALWAADDPLIGHWKLDASKSKITDLMRVAEAGPNRYTLIFNNGDLEPIVADGTDQPALFGTTLAVTIAGPTNWKVVRKKDGKTQLTGMWKLSEDGKTLTDTFTSYHADGSKETVNYVYLRTAGQSGFAGSWESQGDTVDSSFELQIQASEGGGLSFIYPGGGPTKGIIFDGKEYPREGKYVPAGSVSSGQRVNERTVELTDKIKGRINDTQRIELSPDLKSLTITVHPAGQSKPNVLVFDRE